MAFQLSAVVQPKSSGDVDVVCGASVQPTAPSPGEPPQLSGPEVAARWGVTMRALRFYEMRGLISPRRNGGTRTYSQFDSQRVGLILRTKKLGFTLSEISQMIRGTDAAVVSPGLQLTAPKCLKQIEHLECELKRVIAALAELRQIHLELCIPAGDSASDRSSIEGNEG